MARLTSVKQIWTFILGFVVALVAVAAGPAAALRILEAHEHPRTSAAIVAVALGALSFVPLIALLIWMYFRSDEYERHGMLLNASIAFAVSVPMVGSLDLLQRSDLLPAWASAPRWWTMIGCWMISILGVHIARRHAA